MTQVRVLLRVAYVLVALTSFGAALMTDAKVRTVEPRVSMSANSSGQPFDLRCEVRE